jgi:hypothetical protein
MQKTSSLKSLGFVISSKGIQVNPAKIDTIVKIATPTNKKLSQSFGFDWCFSKI